MQLLPWYMEHDKCVCFYCLFESESREITLVCSNSRAYLIHQRIFSVFYNIHINLDMRKINDFIWEVYSTRSFAKHNKKINLTRTCNSM